MNVCQPELSWPFWLQSLVQLLGCSPINQNISQYQLLTTGYINYLLTITINKYWPIATSSHRSGPSHVHGCPIDIRCGLGTNFTGRGLIWGVQLAPGGQWLGSQQRTTTHLPWCTANTTWFMTWLGSYLEFNSDSLRCWMICINWKILKGSGRLHVPTPFWEGQSHTIDILSGHNLRRLLRDRTSTKWMMFPKDDPLGGCWHDNHWQLKDPKSAQPPGILWAPPGIPTDGIGIHIFNAVSASHPCMLQQGGCRWPGGWETWEGPGCSLS